MLAHLPYTVTHFSRCCACFSVIFEWPDQILLPVLCRFDNALPAFNIVRLGLHEIRYVRRIRVKSVY